MNERIKLLAEQAEVLANQFEEHWGDGPDTYELFKEKFAELIVRECGVALSPMLRDMVSRGQAYDLIKQHFGVAE